MSMAETNRQPASSRTSTPKPGLQGPGDLDEILSKAIGARIKLTTSAPTSITLEGTIYTACRLTNMLAINTTPAQPSSTSSQLTHLGDYHLIPVSRIQSFNIISLPNASPRIEGSSSGFDVAMPSIGRIDLKALNAREQAAIRKMKEKDATRGKGVGKEGQEIFDALSRTLPTRWQETSIIVSDAVIIAKPYGPDQCTAPKDQQSALVRVRKVLEAERKKLAERASKVAVATPLGGVRKGG